MDEKPWYRKYTEKHLDGNTEGAGSKVYVHPIPNAKVFINGKPVVMEVPTREKRSFLGRAFERVTAKIFLGFLSMVMFAAMYLLRKELKDRQQEKT